MRVALVVMPFASANRPSLAVSLLKGTVEERGIPCDVLYPSIEFAGEIGFEKYQRMAEGIRDTALGAEWVFSQAYFGSSVSTWEGYRDEVLTDPEWGMRTEDWPLIRSVAGLVPAFLARTLEATDWGRYGLVGFTSTFQQTLASLFLARAIRERYPGVLLAAGGANFEAPMGRAYMERFPFLDFVANGEADVSFPDLCVALSEGSGDVPAGILHRSGNRVLPEREERAAFTRLDGLPQPDFSDYFEAFNRAFPPPRPRVYVSLEASRGCWWGQTSHCTFCGLNGESLTYRRKSAGRVAAEVDEVGRRYPGVHVMFADNILDMLAFRDLIPRWAASGDEVPKFFEVKPALRRAQLALLVAAGVTEVQAGIESLSDGSLSVMRKGVSAAENVAFLRWCAELGITVHWNLIHGSPKETSDNYAESLAVAGKITHLEPPYGIFRVRLDRYSPNHSRWREEGFSALRLLPAYRHVFPFPDEDLERLASFFDYEVPQNEAAREASESLVAFVRKWCADGHGERRGEFAVREHLDGGWVLVDTRMGRPSTVHRLDILHLALLLAADAPSSAVHARSRVEKAFPSVAHADLDAASSFLLEREAIAQVGSSLVTLPLLPSGLRVGEMTRYQSERMVDHGRRRTAFLVSC